MVIYRSPLTTCAVEWFLIVDQLIIFPYSSRTSVIITTVDDIEWSDNTQEVWLPTVLMHTPHDIILQAGMVYLSFKTTVDGIQWSDSIYTKTDC